jgi:hypothetical protein
VIAASRPTTLIGAIVVLAAFGLTAGCQCTSSTSADEGQDGAGPDCASQLRFRGVTYTGYRFTATQPAKLGYAMPVCAGKVIAGGPIAVWSFRGQAPSKVIGRQGLQGRVVVYVADAVSPSERDRILADIAPRG